jgi:alkylation response protein AidB-like acyl-CoA dehydrogenase
VIVMADTAKIGDPHVSVGLVQESVQLAGGIGITEEYAVSHLLRRVRVDEQLHGDAQRHLAAFAAAPDNI